MDELEARLRAARPISGHRSLPLTDRAKRELADLMLAEHQAARATPVADVPGAGRQRRWTRSISAAVIAAVALSGVGIGAAATQWRAWTYVPQADLVVARDWYDADDVYLGACESRIAVNELPPGALDDARAYLASIDVEKATFDAEVVAAELNAVGRLDELPRLIPGADPETFDLHHEGGSPNPAFDSDARILQSALMLAIFGGMSESLAVKWPELSTGALTARVQTQCTSDPPDAPDP